MQGEKILLTDEEILTYVFYGRPSTTVRRSAKYVKQFKM